MTLQEKEKYIASQEKIWAKEKKLLEREYTIKAERKSLKDSFKEKRNKIANSKILIWFLFINCTIIELFTIWVIAQELNLAEQGMIAPDLSPLMALISAVVAEVIGFAIYAIKSTKENTEGGIVYEATMRELNNSIEEDPDSCG